MTDRPQSSENSADRVKARAAGQPRPGQIVVSPRARRRSASLLPPLLIVLAGTAFLTYRARSSDWRGISSFFESRPIVVASRTPAPLPKIEEPEPAPAPALPPVKEIPPVAEVPAIKETPKDQEPTKEKETVAAEDRKPEPPKVIADPLEDIQREAEQTRDRIADLEKLKENEARKLDESAVERERAARLSRRLNPRFRGGQGAPDQVEKMFRAQAEQIRRQMAALAEMQRREMEAMHRRFLNDGGPNFVPPPPLPMANLPEGFGRLPRFPENGGKGDEDLAQAQVFRGQGGVQTFRFQFRQGRGLVPESDVPPPPPPRPRQFD